MRICLVIVSILLITGCAGKSKFDCPATYGVRCQSISKIDSMIDDGSINAQANKKTKKGGDYLTDKITFPERTLSNAPTRTTEQILELWVAPYESIDGVYYQQAFLNVVVKNGTWVKPVVDDLTWVE
jgi:type IV conjugative transfer system lipoprotein TraV